jgi:radical SAM superfamily enzyme YgiQ (UPF0313 family)
LGGPKGRIQEGRDIPMKILLVKPPLNRNIIAPAGGEPLELEYLAASVKEHDVDILDMRVDRGLHKKLETSRPQVVGVTGYTCDANSAKAVMREVKKFDHKIVTAVGGQHATFLPSDFDLPFVDFVFFGMGDLTFKEFIRVLDKGGDPRSVRNLALRTENGLSFTGSAPLDLDLDALPFPARHLTRHYRKKYRDQWRNRVSMVLTSRGCPFRCNFCACWKLLDGKYLVRSPESVVEELMVLPEDTDLVYFADDNTLHNIRQSWRLYRLIQSKKLKFRYSMFARADTIVRHPDLIACLRDIGLSYLTVGIESIRDEKLEGMKKRTTVAMNNEAIRILQRLGIANAAHFIVDPNFGREEFRDLFRYVKNADLFQPVFTVLTPYPGTDLYSENRGKIVIHDFDYFDVIHSVFPTRLERKEFYREIERLYIKCYCFRRYFRSLLRDLWLNVMKSKHRKPYKPDRLPFLTMLFLLAFSYPLRYKFRRIYKSEPLAGPRAEFPPA